MKKFKSFIAVLLCLAAVFCTAGCSASKKSALNISGAQIDYETFLYYFDQVHAFPEKYELAADATNEQMIDAAIELCCEYVAVNTKLSEYGLTLSASEKRSASNNLEDLWHDFHHHRLTEQTTDQCLHRFRNVEQCKWFSQCRTSCLTTADTDH